MANLANSSEGDQALSDTDNTNTQTVTEGAKPSGEAGAGNSADLFEGIPDDHPVRKVVQDLRGENASKRQLIHERDSLVDELKGQLAEAKTPEEVKKLTDTYEAKLAEKELAITRKDVAREFGLPAKVESALKGADLESLRTEAKEWQELFGGLKPAPLTPSGGRSPAEPVDDVKSIVDSIRSRRQ